MELVAEGLKVSQDECPSRVNREGRDPEFGLALDVLDIFLKTRAKELDMAPAYLASRGDLYDLVKASAAGRAASAEVRVLSGWRHELVGDDLLGLLAGNYSISLASGNAEVVVRRLDGSG